MSGLAEAFFRGTQIEEKARTPVVEVLDPSLPLPVPSLYDQQVHLLVNRLFLHPEHGCDCVGFTAADDQTDTGLLCLAVARMLAEGGKHNVGLIDASPGTSIFESLLRKQGLRAGQTCEFEPRLWIVQREEWLTDARADAMSAETLSRLSDLTRKFDCSILCCGPMSALAARIGRVCDGLVLVVTANRTRRLVAQNVREQLEAVQVPVLGTVLAERRFPIPTALYRRL